MDNLENISKTGEQIAYEEKMNSLGYEMPYDPCMTCAEKMIGVGGEQCAGCPHYDK